MSTSIAIHESSTTPSALEIIIDDAVESIETAIREVSSQYAVNEIERGRLFARLEQLTSGARSLRRARVRRYIDAYLPPVTFFFIEYADREEPATPEEVLRGDKSFERTMPHADLLRLKRAGLRLD